MHIPHSSKAILANGAFPSHPTPLAALRVDGKRRYEVIEEECVGCNLCAHVCPVENCITMAPQPATKPKLVWANHPNNPLYVPEAAE